MTTRGTNDRQAVKRAPTEVVRRARVTSQRPAQTVAYWASAVVEVARRRAQVLATRPSAVMHEAVA